jgi:hypothetical protein
MDETTHVTKLYTTQLSSKAKHQSHGALLWPKKLTQDSCRQLLVLQHKAGAKKASTLLVNPEIFLAPFRCLGSTYWTVTHMCNSG